MSAVSDLHLHNAFVSEGSLGSGSNYDEDHLEDHHMVLETVELDHVDFVGYKSLPNQSGCVAV